MFELIGQFGMRIVVVFGRRHVLLKNGALSKGDLAMVGVMCANDLDVVETNV